MGRLAEAVRLELRSLNRLARPRTAFWAKVSRLLPSFALPRLRAACYRLCGCKISQGVTLLGPLDMIGDGDIAPRLSVAAGSIVAPNVTFGLDAPITIGKNVSVGPAATLYTATHAVGFGSRRMTPSVTPKPIVVEDGVWIGMHCLILPGVTLGQGCVISAGSVVNTDVPPNTLASGNPAAVVDKLPFGNR